MAEATDSQMQAFFDQRIRTFGELARTLYLAAKDHKAAIDDEYARASGTNRYNDARTDGPPHLLQSGNGANPDDLLNFNQFITAFTTIIDGSDIANDAANAAAMRSAWAVLQRACVRPIGS